MPKKIEYWSCKVDTTAASSKYFLFQLIPQSEKLLDASYKYLLTQSLTVFYVCCLFICRVPSHSVFVIHSVDIWLQLLFLHRVREPCRGFLSCWGPGILIICGWFRASLHKALSLNAWGNSWLQGSERAPVPDLATNSAVDWTFFPCPDWSLLSFCPFVLRLTEVPAAFAHCEHQAPGSHCGCCLTTQSAAKDFKPSMKVTQLLCWFSEKSCYCFILFFSFLPA